ncbi:hypothetical protein D7D52_07520 [Nocardia yunnanensis]|uniref:Uncharacterized protein n=1 Tax=Nocardia yunnanensis TaxID=2382165 RepID=A0A386Z7U6_9NOCA|nr:hypothetical protein D7D52_07520 [Nocardia yunnanensis]
MDLRDALGGVGDGPESRTAQIVLVGAAAGAAVDDLGADAAERTVDVEVGAAGGGPAVAVGRDADVVAVQRQIRQ